MQVIIYMLLSEHILNYVLSNAKRYYINKEGFPDNNGVMRSSKEIFFSSVGLIVASIVFGWSLHFLVYAENYQKKIHPFEFLWIEIDVMIVAIQLVYSYFMRYMVVKGELRKSFYLLAKAQQEFRDGMNKQIKSFNKSDTINRNFIFNNLRRNLTNVLMSDS